jgi:ribosomal protein L40E
MAKIPEAQDRLFKNVFVCKNCKTKMKSDIQKVLKGKVKCRKCGKKAFRPIKKSK